jgi:EAL domain-containing protein (putative c-di-GMP-specific phosphodiesterase class I)
MEPRAPAAPRPHAGTGADATLYVPQKAVREVTLHVQQLLKLRSGGRTRRYEVLLRSRSRPEADSMSDTMAEILASQGETSTIDRYIAGELIVWLGAHRDVWDTDPSSFSVNLAPSTMFDAEFLLWIAQRLAEFEVGPGVIGFELPERAFVENRAAAERFVAQCEKLGCFLVLDDFTLHSEALPSLASSAVRLVKVDAALTTRALREKLAQAMVIGIAQCAKVLGVHCVAKRVDTAMARQWLSAVGIDFAQGFLLEKPRPLEELATTGAAAKA